MQAMPPMAVRGSAASFHFRRVR